MEEDIVSLRYIVGVRELCRCKGFDITVQSNCIITHQYTHVGEYVLSKVAQKAENNATYRGQTIGPTTV